jgi:hypothetical protein
MEEKGILELKESSVIADDIEKKIRTVGVRGLDFEKAKELGLFNRISNLLCATHASVMAAYRIYGGVDYLLSEFGGRKNEINREMNNFEKAFTKFINFWTDYYAHGGAGREVNEETEVLYRRIMEWAQLPYQWELGDKQRVDDNGLDVAIRMDVDDKQYTFRKTVLDGETVGESDETWCVTKYDVLEHKQTTVEDNMDKASAMMVAKLLSADDTTNIYTASMVRDYMERKTEITPYKAYKANETVGRLTKMQK